MLDNFLGHQLFPEAYYSNNAFTRIIFVSNRPIITKELLYCSSMGIHGGQTQHSYDMGHLI